MKENSDGTACTSIDVVSIKILQVIHTFMYIFWKNCCQNSDGKWTIKCPAKKQFGRNSIRISTVLEIRQRCPNSTRILKPVQILLEFGQRSRISTIVKILMELQQDFFLLWIFLSIFHQNLGNVYDLYLFLLSTFHWQYSNILINYICNISQNVSFFVSQTKSK